MQSNTQQTNQNNVVQTGNITNAQGNVQPTETLVSGQQIGSTTQPIAITNIVDQKQLTPEEIKKQQEKKQLDEFLSKATDLEKKEKYGDAIQNYQEAHKLAIQIYGENHPHVADSNIKIGIIHALNKDNEKAKSFLEKGLEAKTARVGKLHPEVLDAYITIGNATFEKQGEFAQEYFKKAHQIVKDLIMEAHKRNDTETALNIYTKALTINEKALEKLGDNVGFQLHEGQAQIFLERSERVKAREAFERALKHKQKIHKNQDLEVANWAQKVGSNFLSKGFSVEATLFLRKALEIYTKNEKGNEERIAEIYHQLGYAYYLKELYTDAIELYNNERTYRLKANGNKNDLSLAPAYEGLAQAYYGQRLYNQAIEEIGKRLGLSTTDNNINDLIEPNRILGAAYFAKGLYNKALEAFTTQQELIRKAKGDNNLDLAPVYCQIACVHLARGQYDEAIKYHTSELELKVKNLAADDIAIADAYSHLGNDHLRKGAITEAIQSFSKALDIRSKKFGKDSQNLVDDICNIGHAYKASGDILNALNTYSQALDILTKSKTSTPLEVCKINNYIWSAKQLYGNKNPEILKTHSSEFVDKFVTIPSGQLEGFTIRKPSNSAQSLFEVVGIALDSENVNKNKDYVASLKNLIGKIISERAERFSTVQDFHSRSAQDYVAQVNSDKWLGTETDLKALSLHYRVEFAVYHIFAPNLYYVDVINGGVPATKKVILLAYHGKDNAVSYSLLTAYTKDKKEVSIFAADDNLDDKVKQLLESNKQ